MIYQTQLFFKAIGTTVRYCHIGCLFSFHYNYGINFCICVISSKHFLLCSNPQAAPIPSTPVIVYSGNLFETSSFSIMAENEEICQPLSLCTSLYSLMATFYCFNLEYPPKAKRTLEFLQKVGLSLHDNVKLSPRVASVYAKLKV